MVKPTILAMLVRNFTIYSWHVSLIKDLDKSIKNFVWSGGGWGNQAPSSTQEETYPRKVQSKHPLSVRILDSKILKSIEKPPNLGEYYEKGYLGEHVQLIN